DWKADDWDRQFSKLSLWERAGGKWALGSDSRLTAQGDLLHEMKKVGHIASVTFNVAQILGDNSCADWLAVTSSVPDDSTMDALRLRAAVARVMRDGTPQIGDPVVGAKFPHADTVEATLDGVPKLINAQLARRISKSSLKDPGLELLGKPKPRMF